MQPSGFDSFVLSSASQHGIAIYILSTLAFLALVSYAGYRIGRRQIVFMDFTSLVLLQIGVFFLFVAFAALVGHFPKRLWLATLAVGTMAWLLQWLLIWVSRLSAMLAREDSDIERIENEARTVQALIIGDSKLTFAFVGLLLGLQTLLQLGFLIYCGFLYSPGQMGTIGYNATIAKWALIIPGALQMLPLLIINLLVLISKYTTPTIRNINLATGLLSLVNGGVLVFGPLYIYQEGFPQISILMPPVGALVLYLVGIVAAVVVVPWVIGYLRNAWLSTSLRRSRLRFIERAQELSKRGGDGNFRKQEVERLRNSILKAYTALTKNDLLLVFGLKLLEKFGREGGPEAARTLQEMGFGDNPIHVIQEHRRALIENPFYRFNSQAQTYFQAVENNLDEIAEVHPLLLNFRNLTAVLTALVASAPDSMEIFADQIAREKAEGGLWGWVAQAIPGAVMYGFGYVFSKMYEAFGSKVQGVVDGLIQTFSEEVWRHLFN